MKTWMLALGMLAVIGFTGIADAKGKGSGIRGKIMSVGQGSFVISMHSHKKAATNAAAGAGGTTMTIQYTATTTIMINGAAGKIDGTVVGKHVTVVGSTSGQTVTASSITITDGHHKKKAA